MSTVAKETSFSKLSLQNKEFDRVSEFADRVLKFCSCGGILLEAPLR